MTDCSRNPGSSGEQTARLLATLRQLLRSRGMTYAELAGSLHVSTATVKRLFSQQRMSLARLLDICRVLDLELFELARLSRSDGPPQRQLSLRQEQALAGDEPAMLLFHLLLAGWRLDDIARAWEFERGRFEALLLQLESLGLVERVDADRVRLKVPSNIAWRRDGPVMRRYGAAAMREFLAAPFEHDSELLCMHTRELSAASAATLRRKLDGLEQEFVQLAELDASLPAGGDKRNFGMLLAWRPWVFSIARARKRPD